MPTAELETCSYADGIGRMEMHTNFVLPFLHVIFSGSFMKSMTISLEDAALEWVRVKAACANASISSYLYQLVEEARVRDGAYERAMEAALKFEPLAVPTNARIPSRPEANAGADRR